VTNHSHAGGDGKVILGTGIGVLDFILCTVYWSSGFGLLLLPDTVQLFHSIGWTGWLFTCRKWFTCDTAVSACSRGRMCCSWRQFWVVSMSPLDYTAVLLMTQGPQELW